MPQTNIVDSVSGVENAKDRDVCLCNSSTTGMSIPLDVLISAICNTSKPDLRLYLILRTKNMLPGSMNTQMIQNFCFALSELVRAYRTRSSTCRKVVVILEPVFIYDDSFNIVCVDFEETKRILDIFATYSFTAVCSPLTYLLSNDLLYDAYKKLCSLFDEFILYLENMDNIAKLLSDKVTHYVVNETDVICKNNESDLSLFVAIKSVVFERHFKTFIPPFIVKSLQNIFIMS